MNIGGFQFVGGYGLATGGWSAIQFDGGDGMVVAGASPFCS